MKGDQRSFEMQNGATIKALTVNDHLSNEAMASKN